MRKGLGAARPVVASRVMRTGAVVGLVGAVVLAGVAVAQPRQAGETAPQYWCTSGRAASNCDLAREDCEGVRQELFDRGFESGD